MISKLLILFGFIGVLSSLSVAHASATPAGAVLFKGTSDELFTFIAKSKKPTLVKFGAEYCGPCRVFDAELKSKILPAYKGKVNFVIVDVVESPKLAKEMRIPSGIPYFQHWIPRVDDEGVYHLQRVTQHVGYGAGMYNEFFKLLDEDLKQSTHYYSNTPNPELIKLREYIAVLEIELANVNCRPAAMRLFETYREYQGPRHFSTFESFYREAIAEYEAGKPKGYKVDPALSPNIEAFVAALDACVELKRLQNVRVIEQRRAAADQHWSKRDPFEDVRVHGIGSK